MLGAELKGKIRKGVYLWGYYPALHYLKEQERNENFEVCTILKEVLDEIGKGREWYLSSQTIKVEEVLQNQTYIDNVDYYIEEFKKYMS